MSINYKIWLFLILLFFINQLIEVFGVKSELLYSYLDDVLFFPVVLMLVLFLERIRSSNHNYVLSKSWVVISYLFFSFLFEFVYPIISSRFTRDPIDIIAYLIGVLFFLVFLNKPQSPKCLFLSIIVTNSILTRFNIAEIFKNSFYKKNIDERFSKNE